MTTTTRQPPKDGDDKREVEVSLEGAAVLTLVSNDHGETQERVDPILAEYVLHEETYHCVAEVGSGSEGDVYKAIKSDGSVVAVKEYHGKPSSEQIQKMDREITLRRSLPSEAGIPPIHDFGVTEGNGRQRFILVTGYCEGTSLEQKLTAGWRPTEDEVKNVVYNSLERLREFHKRRIIHRDLKPSNIVLQEDGSVFFPDLGLIRDANIGTIGATAFGGTLDYCAPEQFEGNPQYASDLYSLGRTAWFLMTGKHPKSDISKGLYDQDIDCKTLISLGYTPEFVGIIEKMCQKDPAQRYQNIYDTLKDLDEGRVTETITALVKAESTLPTVREKKTGLLSRIGSGVWGWASHYERKEDSNIRIRRKLFGNRLEIVDIEGNLLYGSDAYSLTKLLPLCNFSSGEEKSSMTLNDKEYRLFELEDEKLALIAQDGTMFGEPFERKEGKKYSSYSVSKVETEEGNPAYVKIAFGGKGDWRERLMTEKGLIGREAHNVELWNAKQGSTKIKEKNKEAVVSAKGEFWCGGWYDEIRVTSRTLDDILYIIARQGAGDGLYDDKGKLLGGQKASEFGHTTYKDSDGKEYISYVIRDKHNQKWGSFLDGKGNVFGGKAQQFANRHDCEGSIELVELNKKLYLCVHEILKPIYNETKKDTVRYVANDGTLLGGNEFKEIKHLQGIEEEYALCRGENDVRVMNTNNELLFGGIHQAWKWYSPKGGLEVMCFTSGEDVVAKDIHGNVLYRKEREKIERIEDVSQKCAAFDDQVVRVVSCYDPAGLNYQELRTQKGERVYKRKEGNPIKDFDKTADGKLSVFLSDGTTELIDVAERIAQYNAGQRE